MGHLCHHHLRRRFKMVFYEYIFCFRTTTAAVALTHVERVARGARRASERNISTKVMFSGEILS